MNINGIVHCMFEQTATFRDTFRSMGYNAISYDISNDFGVTDIVVDLFAEINKCYCREKSIFDNISKDDLILAFFPCTYFSTSNGFFFSLNFNSKTKDHTLNSINDVIDRIYKRTEFHVRLFQLYSIAVRLGLRLIIENPATEPNFLITGQNFIKPTFVDKNRRLRGDYFRKPTAYWFINCEPTNLHSYSSNKYKGTIREVERLHIGKFGKFARSIISDTYATNFICDYILGKKQPNTLPSLF